MILVVPSSEPAIRTYRIPYIPYIPYKPTNTIPIPIPIPIPIHSISEAPPTIPPQLVYSPRIFVVHYTLPTNRPRNNQIRVYSAYEFCCLIPHQPDPFKGSRGVIFVVFVVFVGRVVCVEVVIRSNFRAKRGWVWVCWPRAWLMSKIELWEIASLGGWRWGWGEKGWLF